MPEFSVKTSKGKIAEIKILRGVEHIGLETQFFCKADPSGWDPIYGKSPVHFAGELHKAALSRAISL